MAVLFENGISVDRDGVFKPGLLAWLVLLQHLANFNKLFGIRDGRFDVLAVFIDLRKDVRDLKKALAAMEEKKEAK